MIKRELKGETVPLIDYRSSIKCNYVPNFSKFQRANGEVRRTGTACDGSWRSDGVRAAFALSISLHHRSAVISTILPERKSAQFAPCALERDESLSTASNHASPRAQERTRPLSRRHHDFDRQ